MRNDYLSTRQQHYNDTKETLSVSAYKKTRLKILKEEKEFLTEVDKFALEAAIEHVDRAYQNFFNQGFGFPKFVSKYSPNGRQYKTKTTHNNIRLEYVNGVPSVTLPKLGAVRIVLPAKRELAEFTPKNSRITSATVVRDGSAYRVSLQIEQVVKKNDPLLGCSVSEITAMDMGLKEFCIYGTKDGERIHVKNPRYIRKHEKRLRRFQKALSRKQYDKKTHKGSKNYYKAKARVAKEHRKTANQRKDMHHKLSYRIANSCKVFVCEDLNIKGMMKNHHLAKEIQSVGWGQFLTFVQYKIERKGGIFLKVSRFFPSSKTCAHCGYKNDELTLSDRYWKCPECGTLIDRDENAVTNLANEGIRILSEQDFTVVTA